MTTTFDHAFRPVRSELRSEIGSERIRALHVRSGGRHALVALRQLALLTAALFAILDWGDKPWVWIPASAAIGFVVFSLTVLLHEVVHGAVFCRRRATAERLLGWLYAIPSGLSASQFTRWHLDHHRWLGTGGEDPKRLYLSPQRNRRWFKALYLTPALFPLYFRAARRAGALYAAPLRRRIAWERRAAIAFHMVLATALVLGLGWEAACKLHILPVFLVFPVVFTINRLGQHYDVDPRDPVRWGTLLRPSPFLWDVLFLWSNYHLEHHYFPRVPFYRLPQLRRALDPFFEAHGVPARTYTGLLKDWFVWNRVPHTNWHPASVEGPADAATARVAD